MNVIGVALEELYRIFSILNHDKFSDSLPEPVITIQKTRGNVLGHFSAAKVWRDKNNVKDGVFTVDDADETAYYEINIDPRWVCTRTTEEVVETLLHEMCHYRNEMEGINDCNGSNHNKKFKSMAESVGLLVEKGSGVGYGYTSLSDELKQYIEEEIEPDDKAFEYFRAGAALSSGDNGTKKPREKKTFKYTCPFCEQTAKGKRDIVLKCGVCDVEMEIEDED